MKIIHKGTKVWEGDWSAWPERDDPDWRDEMEAWALDGEIFADDGSALEGRSLARMRDRLLQTYDHLPMHSGRRRPQGPRRFLIPGLWPWGTIPAMGGNYKAGKTTLACELTRALVIPGYRFLDYFEPMEGMDMDLSEDPDPDHDLGRGVVLINAETPPEDFEAALAIGMPEDELGVTGPWDLVTVEHLEDLGGAQIMDLTKPAIYDLWANRLTHCHDCDGLDDWTPFTVIVDGVTAILQASGKNPETDFGLWYAAFKRLLRECDIPNGMPIGHNTMNGSHLLGGTLPSSGPDGLWSFSLDKVDRPKSARRFTVNPRTGGVAISPTRVVLTEEGRPVIQKKAGEAVEDEPVEEKEDSITVLAHSVADYVREHPGAHGEEITQNVEHGGWKDNILKARSKAIALGLIREERCRPGCSVCTKSHHRRTHYYPV